MTLLAREDARCVTWKTPERVLGHRQRFARSETVNEPALVTFFEEAGLGT